MYKLILKIKKECRKSYLSTLFFQNYLSFLREFLLIISSIALNKYISFIYVRIKHVNTTLTFSGIFKFIFQIQNIFKIHRMHRKMIFRNWKRNIISHFPSSKLICWYLIWNNFFNIWMMFSHIINKNIIQSFCTSVKFLIYKSTSFSII